jgi:hypothetical protein
MVTAYQVALEIESRGLLLLELHEQIVKHQSYAYASECDFNFRIYKMETI